MHIAYARNGLSGSLFAFTKKQTKTSLKSNIRNVFHITFEIATTDILRPLLTGVRHH